MMMFFFYHFSSFFFGKIILSVFVVVNVMAGGGFHVAASAKCCNAKLNSARAVGYRTECKNVRAPILLCVPWVLFGLGLMYLINVLYMYIIHDGDAQAHYICFMYLTFWKYMEPNLYMANSNRTLPKVLKISLGTGIRRKRTRLKRCDSGVRRRFRSVPAFHSHPFRYTHHTILYPWPGEDEMQLWISWCWCIEAF